MCVCVRESECERGKKEGGIMHEELGIIRIISSVVAKH